MENQILVSFLLWLIKIVKQKEKPGLNSEDFKLFSENEAKKVWNFYKEPSYSRNLFWKGKI